MEYTPEEYTRYYIIQALFKLMNEYRYDKISVTDIAEKAGVGRATFYRYFKSKEDVILFYFQHNTKRFVYNRRFLPRCKEDYIEVVSDVLTLFKQNSEPFKLLRKARLEYLYLDYLNTSFKIKFQNDNNDANLYQSYLYSGMLFNVSMAWLDNDCKEDIHSLAKMIVDAIYFE